MRHAIIIGLLAAGLAWSQAQQPTPFVAAANQVYVLTAPQTVFSLSCGTADIYLNGLLQSEGGVDYSVDATGLVATFAQPAQAGDVVKVIYRCAGGAELAMTQLDKLIERERIRRETRDSREVRGLLRRASREVRAIRRERQGHLAMYFPIWFSCWRRQVKMAYKSPMIARVR